MPSTSTANTTETGVSTSQPEPDKIRLPDYIIPLNYKLDLKVFFQPIGEDNSKNKFEGQLLIDFKLTRPSNRIVLHADNRLRILDTLEIHIVQSGEIIRLEENQHFYSENQLYEIQLDRVLPDGEYKLKLDYTGDYGLPSNIIGFYKTQYKEDGVTKFEEFFFLNITLIY